MILFSVLLIANPPFVEAKKNEKKKILSTVLRKINLIKDKDSKTLGPVSIKKADSTAPNVLQLEIKTKNKFSVKKVLYTIRKKEYPFPKVLKSQADAYNENGKTYVKIDIAPVTNGDHYLFLKIVLKKQKAQIKSLAIISFTKDVLEEIDGDLVPPDPGEAGKSTITGVDSDQDGTRDDVERWINQQNLPTLQRASLIETARLLQARTLVSQDREASNEITRKILSYDYCLRTRFDEDSRKNIIADLNIEQYNTRERLIEWARTQGHFGGSKVELDTNESNWSSYCQENQ